MWANQAGTVPRHVTRRGFATAIASLCSAGLVGEPAHASTPSKLVDVHTHLGQFGNAGQSADGPRLVSMLSQAGIQRAVCVSAEACFGAVDLGNRYVFGEVSKHDMLSMALVVHPYHYASSVRLLQEMGSHPKVVAVKLHPHLGGYHISSVELARLLEKEIAPRGLPVLSHVANDSPNVQIADFLRLAKRFPQTRFIGAHLGMGVLGDPHSLITAWADHAPQNVWLDMATLRFFYTDALTDVLSAVGPSRICFGTDAPLYWPAAFARGLETLALKPEHMERVAWKNAKDVMPRLPHMITRRKPERRARGRPHPMGRGRRVHRGHVPRGCGTAVPQRRAGTLHHRHHGRVLRPRLR